MNKAATTTAMRGPSRRSLEEVNVGTEDIGAVAVQVGDDQSRVHGEESRVRAARELVIIGSGPVVFLRQGEKVLVACGCFI